MYLYVCQIYSNLQKADTVCLADYCDYFRCDVVSGKRKPDFWDVALCLEDDMEELAENCQVKNLLMNK